MQSLHEGQLGLGMDIHHMLMDITGVCPGAQSEEARKACTGNYHSCMPGIQTQRAQPGICKEALAVTARLAEPPSRSNTDQGKACSASWLPDASEMPQLS